MSTLEHNVGREREMNEMFDKLDFIFLTVLLGILGGVANWLMSDDHTFFQFIASVFLAGFVGYLAGILCVEWHYNRNVTFFVCGVSGLSAKILLEQFRRMMIQRLSGAVDKVMGPTGRNFYEPTTISTEDKNKECKIPENKTPEDKTNGGK